LCWLLLVLLLVLVLLLLLRLLLLHLLLLRLLLLLPLGLLLFLLLPLCPMLLAQTSLSLLLAGAAVQELPSAAHVPMNPPSACLRSVFPALDRYRSCSSIPGSLPLHASSMNHDSRSSSNTARAAVSVCWPWGGCVGAQ
jgi:hypothetical protein